MKSNYIVFVRRFRFLIAHILFWYKLTVHPLMAKLLLKIAQFSRFSNFFAAINNYHFFLRSFSIQFLEKCESAIRYKSLSFVLKAKIFWNLNAKAFKRHEKAIQLYHCIFRVFQGILFFITYVSEKGSQRSVMLWDSQIDIKCVASCKYH